MKHRSTRYLSLSWLLRGIMRRSSCFFIVILFMAIHISSAYADEMVDRILAVVNGKIITLFEVNQQIKIFTRQFDGRAMTPKEKKAVESLRKKVLEQMVDDILLEGEAKRLKMEISDAEIKNEIDSFKKQHRLTEKQLMDQLKLEDMTRKDYEEKIKKDIMRQRLIGAMVRRKVVITEEDMKTYYNEHKGNFSQDKKLELALLVVDPSFDIQELLDRLRKGEISFGEAASMYSLDPTAKKSRGELGTVRWADMRDSWKEVLQGMGKGDISKPFDLNGNQALLHIIDITPGEITPFKDVKAKIRDILYRPRIEKRFKEYMDGLRAKAVVDIRL